MGRLYAPVQTATHVAAIDDAERDVVTTIDAGEMARAETTTSQQLQGSLAAPGLEFGERDDVPSRRQPLLLLILASESFSVGSGP
ncbi:hypothetical protein GS429_07880 [Natronorubrum sp. JWXQ-INN-674]|uniref:Uncharacterized protein n=1 Tax=Natronorubrum halalkaliphilum TaxID=2691917 RepID=A0A6B0VLG6_9EURY|nr:hypothetical protein [Natronorubrum halalkaliphilum]MXV61977.1 hypothetical protein [Natronorubrum halalkaliphilum]